MTPLVELVRLPAFWGLDALGLALLIGYQIYVGWVLRRHPERTHRGRSNRLRRAWIETVRAGGMDILAIQTLRNWVRSATLVASTCILTGGSGLGVVTGTGPTTELGRIGRMIAQVQTLTTPLTNKMAAFGRGLALAIIALAGTMFLIGRLFHDFAWGELVMAAISFAVAAIPEGLPAVLTIILALGVQRMAQRNAITRRLPAVEPLGSVTVICTDKTGTLTRNEMTVRHVVTRVAQYQVSGIGYAPDGLVRHAGLAQTPDLQALVEVMALCNGVGADHGRQYAGAGPGLLPVQLPLSVRIEPEAASVVHQPGGLDRGCCTDSAAMPFHLCARYESLVPYHPIGCPQLAPADRHRCRDLPVGRD